MGSALHLLLSMPPGFYKHHPVPQNLWAGAFPGLAGLFFFLGFPDASPSVEHSEWSVEPLENRTL